MAKTYRNDSAYPISYDDETMNSPMDTIELGLSKREYFAACALQGMNLCIMTESIMCAADTDITCESAVKYADALIKALNNSD